MTDSINALASVSPIAPSASSTTDPKSQGQGPQFSVASQQPTTAPASSAAAGSSTAEEAVRLVIEPVSGGTGYTYKLFDRATGALLVELPREDAKKMSEDPGYSAGQVISTKA